MTGSKIVIFVILCMACICMAGCSCRNESFIDESAIKKLRKIWSEYAASDSKSQMLADTRAVLGAQWHVHAVVRTPAGLSVRGIQNDSPGDFITIFDYDAPQSDHLLIIAPPPAKRQAVHTMKVKRLGQSDIFIVRDSTVIR